MEDSVEWRRRQGVGEIDGTNHRDKQIHRQANGGSEGERGDGEL